MGQQSQNGGEVYPAGTTSVPVLQDVLSKLAEHLVLQPLLCPEEAVRGPGVTAQLLAPARSKAVNCCPQDKRF